MPYQKWIYPSTLSSVLMLSSLTFATENLNQDTNEKVDPYAINNGLIPPKSVYDGPLFKLNVDYPSSLPENITIPGREALNGNPISKHNALEYVYELKSFVESPMKTLIEDPEAWNNSPQAGWYSMLWAGEDIKATGWEGREAIYGTYTGQIQPASVYADSHLTANLRNYAAIYFNKVAATTLHKVWQKCHPGSNDCPPSLENNEAQFPEGSVIIKAASASASPEEWPVLEGAAKWQIYRKPFDLNGTINYAEPELMDTYVTIFDIIVKDYSASPETGWVFTTLVYDKDAPGSSPWERMVPLGAMWGNDPDINSTYDPHANLEETYVNPNAPEYATVTLGYGGRLSGPFDISVKDDVYIGERLVNRLPSSSCMSCHGTVSYVKSDKGMPTYLYPAKTPITEPLRMYSPGSDAWNRWFQNRPGTQPQSTRSGAIALDYSTALEMSLMNYTSQKPLSETNMSSIEYEQFWDAWRVLQKEFRH